MNKFKIGDKVIRNKSSTNTTWNDIYCKKDFSPSQDPDGTFEIIDIDIAGSIKLKYNNDGYYYWYNNFELKEPELNFKVGDIVRFKDNIICPNSSYFGINTDNLEIKEVRNSTNNYLIYNHDKSNSWYVFEYEIEHIPESCQKENFHNTKVKIFNKEQSKQVQEIMFKKGFAWGARKDKKFKDYVTHFPGHLYFWKCNNIGFTNLSSEDFYQNHENREISVNDIIGYILLIRSDFNKEYMSDLTVNNNSLKGGKIKQKMGTIKTIYKITIVDKRTSEIIVDTNVAAQDSTSAVLKAMESDYDVEDVDHYHYNIGTLTEFESEKDDTTKKK